MTNTSGSTIIEVETKHKQPTRDKVFVFILFDLLLNNYNNYTSSQYFKLVIFF